MRKPEPTKKELAELRNTTKKRLIKRVGYCCYLLIQPNQTKTYIARYQKNGKRHQEKIADFQAISLTDAKKIAIKLADNEGSQQNCPTFGELAEDFLKRKMASTSAGHQVKIMALIDNNILPVIRHIKADEVNYEQWYQIFENINVRGAQHTRERCRKLADRIIRYGQCQWPTITNYPQRMAELYTPPRTRHFDAVITPEKLAVLLCAIEQHNNIIVKNALKFQALSMLRPSNTCNLQWRHVNFKTRQLEIPGSLCKANIHTRSAEQRQFEEQVHRVPLSKQMIALIEELHPFTGRTDYVFSGANGRKNSHAHPIRTETLNKAIKQKKLPFDHVSHGFRATARTLLSKVFQMPEAWLELQLGHIVKDANGRAYNRVDFIMERERMMQVWSDYLSWLVSQHQQGLRVDKPEQLIKRCFQLVPVPLVRNLSEHETANNSS